MTLLNDVDLLSIIDYNHLSNRKEKKRMDEYEALGGMSEPIEVDDSAKTHVVQAPVKLISEKPNAIKQKIGYYVERKHFGTKLAQAEAFAKNRSSVFGRIVLIKYIAHDGVETIVDTIGVDL